MPKLFVFGIGGTGARVLKSLTMLLAAGIKPGPFELVPVLIDPHESMPEQNTCKSLMKLYADIHSEAYHNVTDREDGFFRTPVSTLASLDPGTGLRDSFGIEGSYNVTFGQFIEKNNLPQNSDTQDFLSLLFSKQDNFMKSLSVGFKGNPNVGSVVLNGIRETPLFRAFERAFGQDDRVFLIGSIFGGTGAAGLPLLLKNVRQHTNAMIKNAQVGALAIMPYFKLSDPDTAGGTKSDIDSRNFLTKTKSALTYYIGNINNLDALYYLADPYEQSKAYKNDEQVQPDAAHLVELLGAQSVIHFASNQFTDRQQQVFEYCLKDDDKEINFTNLGDETAHELAPSLTALYLFQKLHRKVLSEHRLPFRKTCGFDDRFFNQSFFKSLLHDFLTRHFEPWLKELALNERSFNPYNFSNDDHFGGSIKGKPAARKLLPGLIARPADCSDLFVGMAKNERRLRYLHKANKKGQYLSMAFEAIRNSLEEHFSL